MQKKAIILFSSGLDSTTCLAIAKSQNYQCYTLSFAYGQQHEVETRRAAELAADYGVAAHQLLTLPLDKLGGSSLTDRQQPIADYEGKEGIPTTYVPARNTIFLSFALAYAEVIGARDIIIGANVIDYSGYPDCRPDYLTAFAKMAALATKAGREGEHFQIHAPLLKMNKAEIILAGTKLGIDYAKTISCYRANAKGEACGRCDSCTFRKKGFQEAGIPDPTPYY